MLEEVMRESHHSLCATSESGDARQVRQGGRYGESRASDPKALARLSCSLAGDESHFSNLSICWSPFSRSNASPLAFPSAPQHARTSFDLKALLHRA